MAGAPRRRWFAQPCGFRLDSLLGLLLAGVLLAACTGVPVPPAYTDEELAARCVRTGGWWRPGSQIAGHCEYKD